ncbi:hypothetical protein ABID25_000970 [Mesorhizobium abyssinicae]
MEGRNTEFVQKFASPDWLVRLSRTGAERT